MQRFHAGNPFLEQIVDDWESLCKLAFKEAKLKRGESKKSVWEPAKERSVPTLISLEDNEYLVIEVIYNKVTREDHIDFRIFEKEVYTDEEENKKERMKKTSRGVNFSVAQWKRHLPKLIKLLRKYE